LQTAINEKYKDNRIDYLTSAVVAVILQTIFRLLRKLFNFCQNVKITSTVF